MIKFRKATFWVIALALFLFPGHELVLNLLESAAAQTGSLGTTVITSPTGNEIITLAGTGPQIQSVTMNQMRNSTGYQLTTTTTGTVNTTVATDNLIFTAAQTGAITANLPPNPVDGQLFSLNNGTGSNFSGTITVATTDGSTIANGATAVNLGAAGSQEWQYTLPSKIWYRLR